MTEYQEAGCYRGWMQQLEVNSGRRYTVTRRYISEHNITVKNVLDNKVETPKACCTEATQIYNLLTLFFERELYAV